MIGTRRDSSVAPRNQGRLGHPDVRSDGRIDAQLAEVGDSPGKKAAIGENGETVFAQRELADVAENPYRRRTNPALSGAGLAESVLSKGPEASVAVEHEAVLAIGFSRDCCDAQRHLERPWRLEDLTELPRFVIAPPPYVAGNVDCVIEIAVRGDFWFYCTGRLGDKAGERQEDSAKRISTVHVVSFSQ